MNVVLYPSENLHVPCRQVEKFDHGLRTTVASMVDTMYASSGVGLAAPQIGIQERLVVIDPSAGQKANDLVTLVNPKITWRSSSSEMGLEGCLSLPGITVNISRPTEVEIEYQDVLGQTHHNFFTGWPARVVQHEIDHLDGVLMIDRASPMEHKMALKNVSKIVRV